MRAVAALLALVLVTAAGSCSHRERANPLDASNPNTGGAPQGFNAIAGADAVSLYWVARPDLAIDGFQVFRLAPGDPLYHALSVVLPTSTSQFFDATARPGLEYHYRIHFVIEGVVAANYSEDAATPGPLVPWVVDAGVGRLLRLSPDGRDISVARTGYGSVSALGVTPGHGTLWVADELAGTLDALDPGTFLGTRIRTVAHPAAVALDPANGNAWVTDRNGNDGAVFHFQPSGATALPASLTLLDDPTGIATDPNDGSVWVTEFDGNRVRHYQSGGLPLGARSLLNPARVAVDSTNHVAWVTSIASGWVWRLSPTLTVLDSFRLQSPVGIALDWRRRIAWICDVDGDALVAVDMDTRAERFRVNGLGNPWDAAVDFSNGDIWVVARGSSRAFRLSASGKQIASVPGLGDPFQIRLDPGQ
jgi:DNA-binding beta-propeller fold protein YncE